MDRMKHENFTVDIVLTSPPYNMTKRKGGNADTGRYDVYKNDFLSEEDYIDFIVCYENTDNILKSLVRKTLTTLTYIMYFTTNSTDETL